MKVRNIFLAAVVALAAVAFTGCPSADGLHNQKSAKVTFEFKGFPEYVTGEFALPGNFDGNQVWDNTKTDIVMKKGEGVSNEITISIPDIQWSLVKVNDWGRSWYPDVSGNGSDAGTMHNFYIDGLDLEAGEITVVVDASSGTATPVVK